MTREEAIEYLKRADVTVGRDIKTKTAEALEMAIKALEQEPIDYKAQYERFSKKAEIVISQLRADRDRLQDAFDKIRDQLKSNLRGVEITLEVLVENDPLRPKMEGAKTTLEDCLELIDKVESEDKE